MRRPNIVAGSGYSRLLLVASVVFGHLFAVIHGASTEHILCADHGLYEHDAHAEPGHSVSDFAASDGHDHSSHESELDDSDDHESHDDHGPGEESGHDVCDIELGTPASDVPQLAAVTSVPVSTVMLDAVAAPQLVLAALEATYRLAPKASPPLHG